jgi:hypothetical protein
MKFSARSIATAATVIALCGALTGCSTTSTGEALSFLEGVGRLPGTAASLGDQSGINAPIPAFEGTALGSDARGNKLLVIGDSIIASTAPRYGNDMCRALVPLGWRVAVEAEASQQVKFGREVLQTRLAEGWDAAVVFLGTNFNGNFDNYRTDLDRIVSSLAPRPTLLLTTSLFRPVQQDINTIIRDIASKYSNVRILDWTTLSAYNGVLSPDRVHPTPDGRAVLAQAVSQAAGVAPVTPGECLASRFASDQLSQVVPQDTIAPNTDPVTDPTPTTAPAGTPSTTVTTAPAPTTTTTPPTTTLVPPVSVPATTPAN